MTILQNAHKAGFYDTVMWIGPILLRANADSKNPDVNKFLILKDVYKDLRQWKAATEACHYALRLDEFNMDLQTELKIWRRRTRWMRGTTPRAAASARASPRPKSRIG